MGLNLCESRLPDACAEEGGVHHTTPAELIAINARTHRTMRRIEASRWVIGAIVAAFSVPLAWHFLARLWSGQ